MSRNSTSQFYPKLWTFGTTLTPQLRSTAKDLAKNLKKLREPAEPLFKGSLARSWVRLARRLLGIAPRTRRSGMNYRLAARKLANGRIGDLGLRVATAVFGPPPGLERERPPGLLPAALTRLQQNRGIELNKPPFIPVGDGEGSAIPALAGTDPGPVPFSDSRKEEEPAAHEVPSCDHCARDTYALPCSECKMRFCAPCQEFKGLRYGIDCACVYVDKVVLGGFVYFRNKEVSSARTSQIHKNRDSELK